MTQGTQVARIPRSTTSAFILSGCVKSPRTGRAVAHAATFVMAPVSAVRIDWHVHRIPVASTPGHDDHSAGGQGLRRVNSSRHICCGYLDLLIRSDSNDDKNSTSEVRELERVGDGELAQQDGGSKEKTAGHRGLYTPRYIPITP
jgi:hypothetical protein